MKGHMEKDGFHPHTQSKGVRKSRDQKDKTKGVRMKRTEGKKVKTHLFRVYSTFSTDSDGDRQETAHIRAKNLDEAVKFVKKEFFQKRVQNDLEEDGDDETAYITSTYATDEQGNELSQKQIDKIQEKEGDDAVGWITEGSTANGSCARSARATPWKPASSNACRNACSWKAPEIQPVHSSGSFRM